MSYPEFARWSSIQRLSSEIVTFTEKIDGTNAVIYVPEDATQPILAGSRERWLTKDDGSLPDKNGDNFGFARWVDERKDSLRTFGHGYHYGEFHGAGIQRRYDLKTKMFASFSYWRTDLNIPDVNVVPILYQGEWTEGILEQTLQKLKETGSVLHPGFMKPEGIVITFKNMHSAKFKKLCENDKIHKSQQHGA